MSKAAQLVLDFGSTDFNAEDAERLARELKDKANETRLSITPTIKLFDGRINDWNLKTMFDQVYPTGDRSRYWSSKLIYRLESEWYRGTMDIEIWCGSCRSYAQRGVMCERVITNRYGSFNPRWHLPTSITAQSIVREQHKFTLRRGEGDKLIDNFNCMIRSLEQAIA